MSDKLKSDKPKLEKESDSFFDGFKIFVIVWILYCVVLMLTLA
jgi:hypothetical protein